MENLELDAMYGCQRCPKCHLVPDVTVEPTLCSKDIFFLRCERHGHAAAGDDLAQAVKHWNTYITFVLTGVAQ